jgi:two-component system CheB/CheR fusion protein
VKKEIRDLVVFAVHNILTDAPFTKLDLLSCRNLLIYLEPKAQHKVLPLFHYALKLNGILLLGSSETIGGFDQLFTVIDRKGKLFRRMAGTGVQPMLPSYSGGFMHVPAEPHAEGERSHAPTRPHSIPDLIQQLLVSRYAPASVVVNNRGEVVYIHGRTGSYLEPAPGPPTHNLIEMAREGLQHDLVLALHQAAGQDGEVVRRDVRMKAEGGVIPVNLTVKKIADPEALQGLFLVTFDQVRASKTSAQKEAPMRAAAPFRHTTPLPRSPAIR